MFAGEARRREAADGARRGGQPGQARRQVLKPAGDRAYSSPKSDTRIHEPKQERDSQCPAQVESILIIATVLVCLYGVIGLPKSKDGIGRELEQQHPAWPRPEGRIAAGAASSAAGRLQSGAVASDRAAEGRDGSSKNSIAGEPMTGLPSRSRWQTPTRWRSSSRASRWRRPRRSVAWSAKQLQCLDSDAGRTRPTTA